jgi:hypothetical protein
VGDIEPAIAFYQELLALQWASGSTGELDLSGNESRVYGYVDDAVLESPGKVVLRGWVASTRNPAPYTVAVRLGGATHAARHIRRFKRDDVIKRFGVRELECGFYATFELPGVATLKDLEGMVVLGGLPSRVPDTVLRQSDRLVLSIRTGREA